MRSVHELQLRGKRVVKRVDINSPVDERGEIISNPRLERHGKSIRHLSDIGARVIVLAHQGRKGTSDFVSLGEHARLLERITGRQVEFLPTTDGEMVREAIGRMENGDILLLENVRMWEGEEGDADESLLVKTLAPLTDVFVLDALSVSHREHASVIGLAGHAPSVAGPVMHEEVEALHSMKEGGSTLVLGGGKASDSLKIMEKWLDGGKADRILLGGAISILFLDAQGHHVADSHAFLKANALLEYTKNAKELLSRYGDLIVLPEDVGLDIGGGRVEARVHAIEKGAINDIGQKTIEKYAEEILGAKKVLVNGPMGVYEKKGFELGTRGVLEAISKSKAYSVVGGGHTITALRNFGFTESDFSYVSLSGKALARFISGKELPGLRAIVENKKSPE